MPLPSLILNPRLGSALAPCQRREGPRLVWMVSFDPLSRSVAPLPQVKKIHENEKRLEAGDHPVELLARDFEKNYNMYIFPVHWQFGQLDQHPIDG